MSYQVLARKWRPQRFQDVVGQKHILTALENGLREERLHHAYLFSGTRGVGKTSIARLFAKGLNCEKGITEAPCSECKNCKAIEEGRFIDLIEIDAASRTKVEDTRELLDNVQYKPTVGRFKVYLIDEVHMLSRHSFNALLKTLEEPPEYVKFLLATTDPQKLPITILSRCMQFHLRALEQKQISQHLSFVLNQEHIFFEDLALEKLAKAAQGSIRDALSLTDQAISVSNANVTLTVVQQMLGLMDDNQPLEIIQALSLANGEKLMAIIDNVAHKGVDWKAVFNSVAETLHQIAILQLLPNSAQEETTLHFLAKQISPEDVQFFYQLMLMGKKELDLVAEPRMVIEMTMLRALAFHPKKIIETNANNVEHFLSDKKEQSLKSSQPLLQQNVNKLKKNADSFEDEKEIEAQTKRADDLQSLKQQEQPQINNEKLEKQVISAPVSSALSALQAREQLKARKLELTSNEKKNINLESKYQAPTSVKQTNKKDLQQHFIHIADNERKINSKLNEEKSEFKKGSAINKISSQDEDYRWQWLDPELEKETEAAKASDIKQAIIQQNTPELIEKITKISCERDSWCKLIYDLNITGLTRLMVLNCYLIGQEGKELQLVLKPNYEYLNKPEIQRSLVDALNKKQLTYSITIGENSQYQTALEIKRSIYEELINEAKQSLESDTQLQLLNQTFDGIIDELTIRPVA